MGRDGGERDEKKKGRKEKVRKANRKSKEGIGEKHMGGGWSTYHYSQ